MTGPRASQEDPPRHGGVPERATSPTGELPERDCSVAAIIQGVEAALELSEHTTRIIDFTVPLEVPQMPDVAFAGYPPIQHRDELPSEVQIPLPPAYSELQSGERGRPPYVEVSSLQNSAATTPSINNGPQAINLDDPQPAPAEKGKSVAKKLVKVAGRWVSSTAKSVDRMINGKVFRSKSGESATNPSSPIRVMKADRHGRKSFALCTPADFDAQRATPPPSSSGAASLDQRNSIVQERSLPFPVTPTPPSSLRVAPTARQFASPEKHRRYYSGQQPPFSDHRSSPTPYTCRGYPGARPYSRGASSDLFNAATTSSASLPQVAPSRSQPTRDLREHTFDWTMAWLKMHLAEHLNHPEWPPTALCHVCADIMALSTLSKPPEIAQMGSAMQSQPSLGTFD